MKLNRIFNRLTAAALMLIILITSCSVAVADNFKGLVEQTFTLTPEKGVTVTLKGMMPYNGWAHAAPAEAEDALHAYDITIHYINGDEFEPAADSPISVSFRSKAIAEAIKDENTALEAVHIDDNGVGEAVEIDSAKKDKVCFEAESFSIYLIKTHDTSNENLHPRRIYHFLSPEFTQLDIEGGTHYKAPEYLFLNKMNMRISTQTICSGEALEEVLMPENNNSGLFYGWYKVDYEGKSEDGQILYNWGTETPQHIAFLEPIEFEATDDEDVYLAPLFGRYRFLTFHQDIEGSANASTIVSRKLIALNNDRECTIKISDVRAPSSDPNRIIFWGWEFTHGEGSRHEGQTEIHQTVSTDDTEIPTSITIDDNIIINEVQPDDEEMRHKIYDIWPVFKEARWIEFDVGSSGATYCAPQFIMLDDDTTSFNNVPTRTGYRFDGWYYNVDNGDGTYTKEMVTDANADILTGVTKQLATGMRIEDGKLVLDRSASEQLFRAKWTPVEAADIHVVVWKQKITDDRYASTYEKTYDFFEYDTLSGLSTSMFATDTEQYRNAGFEGYTTSNPAEFTGFHFARTSATDNGLGNMEKEYDPDTMIGDDPKNWKVTDMKVNPNGSTVINVYYDRDLMSITYHYNSYTVPANETTESYTYTATNATTGELYGLVNNQYVRIINEAVEKPYYTFDYRYESTNSIANQQYYGINENHQYVPLTMAGYSYVQTDEDEVYTRYTGTPSNGTARYGIYNGSFVTVYYNNLAWYRTRRTGLFGNYTYSNIYSGDRYTQSTTVYSGSYTGQRYKISGNSMVATNDETGTLYAKDGDTYYRISTTTSFTYNGEPYTGTRYLRSNDGSTRYRGRLYVWDGEGFELTDDDSGEIYGLSNGIYQKLTKRIETETEWRVQSTGAAYNGTRYTRSSAGSNVVVWYGLYGQKFSKYGYVWPTSYIWKQENNDNNNTTGQTMLTGFTMLNDSDSVWSDYHLYCRGNSGSYKIIHCRQKLDNSYSLDAEFCDEARTSSTSINFNFTNKFDGFSVCAYSRSFSASASGATTTSAGKQESFSFSNSNNTLYVYHRRRADLVFKFNENYNGVTHDVTQIKFEQPLGDIEAQAPTVTRDHYVFSGWYEDSTCTQEFDFEHTIMPNANKMVYAKWTPVKYRVCIDPNGGELPIGGGSSTYFNVNYNELVGEYAGIRRNYVPADGGDYVYADFSYDKVSTFPGVTKLDAVYRKAFYINKHEINNTYYHPFTVDGVNYSYSQTGMTLEEFKSCIDMETLYAPVSESTSYYRLVSWHKVKPNGTTEATPFNFHDHLTEDTTLRARWVQLGGYSLVYDPTMTSLGISGHMARVNDPYTNGDAYADRKYADKAAVVILQEPTDLFTTGAGGHESDLDDFTFRGWQIVNGQTHEPVEAGVYYDPGDTMILDARHADEQGVIHMQAYYEKRAASGRRTAVASLTLDANAGDKGIVNDIGLADDGSDIVDYVNKTIKLDRRNNNFDVALRKYRKNFGNADGNYLLGWNKTPSAGSYIPEYYADAVIGVNKVNSPNILYAVWEPMIYLNISNRTQRTVTYTLTFGTDKIVYSGHTNEVTGELDRAVFNESHALVTSRDGNAYTITMQPNDELHLVIPEGEGLSYTVSGSFDGSKDNNNVYSDFMVYNSGAETAVTLHRSGNRWYLNGSNSSVSVPYAYTSSGNLVKGQTGRQVIFTDENPYSDLTLKTRFYDIENGWTDGRLSDSVSPTGMNANAHFTGVDDETVSSDSITAEVHLLHDNTTTKFGLNVAGFDEDTYKFIGWYTTPTAEPYAFSVDGKSADLGSRTITGMTVPPQDTTYYALFVPYIKGDLEIIHDEKDDTAGHCAQDDGLKLRVEYRGNTRGAATAVFEDEGDNLNPARIELDESIIDERNTGSLHVTVSAKPHEDSVYSKTYRNQVAIPSENVVYDGDDGYSYAVFDAPVSERFVDSGSVKGLKELRTIQYSSSFSHGYNITYKYTGRDNQIHTLTRTGSTDTAFNFEEFVISHTPYERTLAGDTIWDVQNLIETKGTSMNTSLNELYTILDKCTVTVVELGGYDNYVRVGYGEAFSDKQMAEHIADATDEDGRPFDHWEIKNTDTHKFVANCYSREFTFKVWNNYTITPIYKENPSPMSSEAANVTIDYIDTSRNSWGTIVDDDESGVEDYMVCDVDLTFVDGDKKINTDTYRDKYDLGIIFEICAPTESGGGVLKDKDCEELVKGENTDDMEKRVNAVISRAGAQGSISKSAVADCTTRYNLYYAKVNNSSLSKFNRIQLPRTFSKANALGRIFRVYAYMKNKDSGNITLSDPIYITMHDYAAKKYEIAVLDIQKGRQG